LPPRWRKTYLNPSVWDEERRTILSLGDISAGIGTVSDEHPGKQ
jgi:hypothetical protein